MSAAQRMEVVFGLRKGEEALTAELLRDFQTEPVTELIVDLGAELYYRWHPSHGVDDEDAILAATAMLTGGKIITQNVKHFPMPGLRVERGWDD